ncbi:MAG: LamG-like jellyroll fold domain-containing protein [Pseudomonadota bacterium]
MSFVINPYRFAASGTAPVSFNPADPANVFIQLDLQNPADASQDRNGWLTSGTSFGVSVDTARTLFGLPTTHFNVGNNIEIIGPPNFDPFSGSDFVMEVWVWRESGGIVLSAYDNIGKRQFWFAAGGALMFPSKNTFNGFFSVNNGGLITNGVWHHVVWQRRTGLTEDTHEFFIDGVLGQTLTTTVRWQAASPAIIIGRDANRNSPFAGNMAQLRITFGEAFYPSTGFAPPQGPFPPVPPA